MKSTLDGLLAGTPLSGGNAAYVESLYERYLGNPDAVAPQWREFFASLGPATAAERAHAPIIDSIAARAQASPAAAAPAARHAEAASEKQAAVSRLVQIYGNRGHLVASIDPLGLMQRPRPRVLELDYVGLSAADLDTRVLHRQPQWLDAQARVAARDRRAARAGVLRHDRRRVRARVRHRGAPVAAGRVPARPHAVALPARRAAQHPLAAHGGRGTGALPAHQVRRPEALLARGRRGADRRCSTT